MSEQSFEQYWAGVVSKKFNISQSDILQNFSSTDKHNSEWRTRENWKYGASVGVAGTPTAYVNGVMVTDFPADEAGWDTFMKSLFATS